jgi:hypothetical protein
MAQASRLLGVYLHLARASNLRRQPMVRDKLLVLAGVTASEMGLDDVAALCRERILAHNGRHLVHRWPTLADANADERFQVYLKQLRRRYSPEHAEHLLTTLGIELGRERETYFNDHEYAAALMGGTPETMPSMLAQAKAPRVATAVRAPRISPSQEMLLHRGPANRLASSSSRRAWQRAAIVLLFAAAALLGLVAVAVLGV